ncbi:hypothetical protein NECAME_06507 [Necator americanus]|uniref:Uncharacterized protein n=1 Tax=Necator americanus TaxID=51031 RepID=W2TVY7_NECAM|nr:hypothetical protein NECAME_06507 [Necator americanus]ETN85212.1 hypothetical protein NECAME_06507 [Necator americanus]
MDRVALTLPSSYRNVLSHAPKCVQAYSGKYERSLKKKGIEECCETENPEMCGSREGMYT